MFISMCSKMYCKTIVYMVLLCGSIHSAPVDISDGTSKSDATLSVYRSLSAPKWPYTPPMKPTRPYTFETNYNSQNVNKKSSPNPKISEMVTSVSDPTQFQSEDSIFSQSAINFISQNYDHDVKSSFKTQNEEIKEKQEFIHFLRSLLWDAEENSIEDEQNQGRQFNPNYSPIGVNAYANRYGNHLGIKQNQNILRWHGVFGRPMPEILKKQGLAAQAYRGFEEGCYKLGCALGINRLIGQIGRMLG